MFVGGGDDDWLVEGVAGGQFGGVSDDECAGGVECCGWVHAGECAEGPPFCAVACGDGIDVGDDGDVGAEGCLRVVCFAE